jgi:hypothetical protein
MRKLLWLIPLFFLGACSDDGHGTAYACIDTRVYKKPPGAAFWYETDPPRRCVNADKSRP